MQFCAQTVRTKATNLLSNTTKADADLFATYFNQTKHGLLHELFPRQTRTTQAQSLKPKALLWASNSLPQKRSLEH